MGQFFLAENESHMYPNMCAKGGRDVERERGWEGGRLGGREGREGGEGDGWEREGGGRGREGREAGE